MRSAILLFVILLASGCMTPSLSSIENSIIYQPQCINVRREIPPDKPDPNRLDDFEEAIIKESHDVLHNDIYDYRYGYFAEARNPRAVVLYCHGNGGNIKNCEQILRLFRDKLHVSILAFDYRGYGRSDGRSEGLPCNEQGLYEDARYARAWLAKRTGVAEKDIVLCGYSLGGGVAVELAAKDGARGLILDRTFTSIPDVADSMVPIIPVGWLLEAKYDSLSKIRYYHGPLLQTHGDEDHVVPFELGKKLFDAANEPKQFVKIRAGDHNDPPDPEYHRGSRPLLRSTQRRRRGRFCEAPLISRVLAVLGRGRVLCEKAQFDGLRNFADDLVLFGKFLELGQDRLIGLKIAGEPGQDRAAGIP